MANPIRMPLRTYVRTKIAKLPADKAREYDTAMFWAFFDAAYSD